MHLHGCHTTALVCVLGLSISASAWQAQKPAAPEKGQRLESLAWPEAETILTPQSVVVIPLGAASKEHGPHLKLRNDLDARRISHQARCRRGICCRRADAHVSLLSRVPRVPRVDLPLARHRSRHDRRRRSYALGLRASTLLRSQHRCVDRARRSSLQQPCSPPKACSCATPTSPRASTRDEGLYRAGRRNARRRGRDIDDAVHRSRQRRHDEGRQGLHAAESPWPAQSSAWRRRHLFGDRHLGRSHSRDARQRTDLRRSAGRRHSRRHC